MGSYQSSPETSPNCGFLLQYLGKYWLIKWVEYWYKHGVNLRIEIKFEIRNRYKLKSEKTFGRSSKEKFTWPRIFLSRELKFEQ